jgi:DNA-binding beta-propeller fold protein YncE
MAKAGQHPDLLLLFIIIFHNLFVINTFHIHDQRMTRLRSKCQFIVNSVDITYAGGMITQVVREAAITCKKALIISTMGHLVFTPKKFYKIIFGPCTVCRLTTILLVFLAFLSPSSSLATPGFSYESTLLLSTGPVGQTRPVSVTCDPVQGEICVTDVRQNALHVLNQFDIQLFRTSTVAELSLPTDGSVDLLGRLVCLDRTSSGDNSITRLNVYGEPDRYELQIPFEGWNPAHLLVTRDGNYLTLDPARTTLAKHDSATGNLIWQRSLADSGGDEIYLGRPAEGPDGQIVVPGGNLGQVLIFDAEGRYRISFGETGGAEGYFSFPVAAAFTPDGLLLVLDRMRHKIIAFDQDNRFVTEFGSLGAGPGQFYHPVAMAADATGRVYVAQGFQGRVQVFQYTSDQRP